MAKIEEINIYDIKKEGYSSSLVVKIDAKGNLVFEGYELGESVKKAWGDSDLEYWLRVAAEDKDTILLWLIKERFTNFADFEAWLEAKDIPSKYEQWA